uniref:Ig-like domain-containing protein n=2 Tax=Canis lupus familiaris TaxID=9615 RepID=A0A8I3PQH6_CANLF
MDWVPFYLLPFIFSTGFCAPPVLTQPPSASASLEASVKLTCTLSSEHSSYFIYWYQQQQPEKAPRYLMKVNSDGSHSRGDGIPSRFSGSSSGADRYLTISNIQSEDEADYYCFTPDDSNSHSDTDKWGSEHKTSYPLSSLPCGDSRGSCSLSFFRALRPMTLLANSVMLYLCSKRKVKI